MFRPKRRLKSIAISNALSITGNVHGQFSLQLEATDLSLSIIPSISIYKGSVVLQRGFGKRRVNPFSTNLIPME